MNTKNLIEELAKNTDLPKTACKKIITFLLARIMKEVAKGKVVKLTGFGIFYRASRKERMGRNPQNGNPVPIAAKKVPRFKAGKLFKSEVN